MTLTVNRARRGVEDAADRAVGLVAGDLQVDLLGPDLRAVRWGGTEVVQRLYMVVRDAPWNTIPGELLEREVVQATHCFRVTFRQRHRFEDIDLESKGEVRGSADGVLVYEMDAPAARSFRYSKIGLNIHRSLVAYRGRPYKATTSGGEIDGTLPEDLDPQLVKDGSLTAMFDHFDRIAFDLDGVHAEFTFEGDRFEMQDPHEASTSPARPRSTVCFATFRRTAVAFFSTALRTPRSSMSRTVL